jgi:hypothetical protein
MSYIDAAKLVKLKRKIVSPNVGFIKQLIEYEKECHAVGPEKEHSVL